MSAQEIEVNVADLREGDVIVRVPKVQSLTGESDITTVVRREVPDPPTEPGSIGRATVTRKESGKPPVRDVLVVVSTDRHTPFFAPTAPGEYYWARSDEITDFRPLVARPEVTRAQLFDVIHPDGLIPAGDTTLQDVWALLGGEG
jgi:hypothetical protein